MAIISATNKAIWVIVLAFSLSCQKDDHNPKLVDYLKAERILKKTIAQNQGLNDSLTVLEKRLGIDAKKELKKLEHKPETWVNLLKALDDEK
ncbi:MAG: hypothetical protein ABIL22_02495 [candidate division WOR-3 bacterium]